MSKTTILIIIAAILLGIAAAIFLPILLRRAIHRAEIQQFENQEYQDLVDQFSQDKDQ